GDCAGWSVFRAGPGPLQHLHSENECGQRYAARQQYAYCGGPAQFAGLSKTSTRRLLDWLVAGLRRDARNPVGRPRQACALRNGRFDGTGRGCMFCGLSAGHRTCQNFHEHTRISAAGHDLQYRGAFSNQPFDGNLLARAPWPNAMGNIGLGLISQLGGYLALTYALGHLPATITSVSLLAQGPLTAIMAAILLAEPLTW